MTTDRELLEMALEALEEVRDAKILALELKPSYHNIISSLHARLAQPDLAKVGEVGVWGEQEPVAWMNKHGACKTTLFREVEAGAKDEYTIPLYTHPPKQEPVIDKSAAKRIATQLGWQPKREWQGLTDNDLSVCDEDGVLLARYWEAKLKEKNSG